MENLKRTYLLLLLCFFTLKISSQTLPAADPEQGNVDSERLRRIDMMLQDGIEREYMNGAVALIARDGKVVYSKAFGWADKEGRKAMDREAIFRIASQTKAITSVAVMMLFEEGKILLDDPISNYIPSFAKPKVLDKFVSADNYTTRPAKREITIRDLLTHTSGVDYAVIGSDKMKLIYEKAGITPGFGSNNLLLWEVISKLGTMPLVHEPGERFTYGLNTDILGYLIEVISGKSLNDFFQERIFKPLQMRDTYFYLPKEKHSRLVPVYTLSKDNKLVKWLEESGMSADYPKEAGTYFSGGAGLSSTIDDYAIFLQMLLNGGTYNGKKLLAKRTVELMTSNQIGDINVRDDKFGLGFQITTEKGQSKLGLSKGSFAWGGYFGTTYWADPKKRMVCLLFTQQAPLRGYVHDKFRALVYQALED